MVQVFSSKDTVENPAYVTPWSLIHFTAGMAANQYMHFWTGQVSHAIYEFIGSKRIFNAVGFTVKKPSSLHNSFGDQGSFTAGQLMRLRGPWTVVTIALFGVFCLAKIEF